MSSVTILTFHRPPAKPHDPAIVSFATQPIVAPFQKGSVSLLPETTKDRHVATRVNDLFRGCCKRNLMAGTGASRNVGSWPLSDLPLTDLRLGNADTLWQRSALPHPSPSIHSTRSINRYPTAGSFTISCGSDGTRSSFWRMPRTATRRYSVWSSCAGPQALRSRWA